MDINSAIPSLQRYGVRNDTINKLIELSRQIDDSDFKPDLRDVSEADSYVLISRALRKAANRLGAEIDHPDLISLVETTQREPWLEELEAHSM